MKKYTEMTKDELMQEKTALEAEYEKIKYLGLSLDMSRGKSGADQLDLSLPMLDVLKSESDMKSESGLDVRNYACPVSYTHLMVRQKSSGTESGTNTHTTIQITM